jgi:hypothetical protein
MTKKMEISINRYAKIVDFGERRPTGSGAYGAYYQLNSELGVKVYFDLRGDSRRAVVLSRRSADIQWTMRIMNMAAKHGLAPRAYKIMSVKVGKRFGIGLFQEHIDGRHDEAFDCSRIKHRLKRIGVIHHDLHPLNIMIRNRKVVVLDFDESDFVGAKRR